MEPVKFMEHQYMTLRKEIEFTRDRMYKTIFAGATLMPAAQQIADLYDITILTILLPILVMTTLLLYISDLHAMMRCGRFIRLHIEKHVPSVRGWEEWLEAENKIDDRRSVDKFVNYSFYMLSSIYYLVSTWLAAQKAYELTGLVGLSIVVMLYLALGSFLLVKVRKWAIVSTKTAGELAPIQPEGKN